MAAHSSVLAWRVPGTGSLVGCRLRVAQSRTRLKRLSSSTTFVNLTNLQIHELFSPRLVISHLFFFLGQQSPVFLAPVIGFLEDNFSTDWGGRRWFQDDSSTLHLLCTYFFCYISSTSDHQALIPELEDPCSRLLLIFKDLGFCSLSFCQVIVTTTLLTFNFPQSPLSTFSPPPLTHVIPQRSG